MQLKSKIGKIWMNWLAFAASETTPQGLSAIALLICLLLSMTGCASTAPYTLKVPVTCPEYPSPPAELMVTPKSLGLINRLSKNVASESANTAKPSEKP